MSTRNFTVIHHTVQSKRPFQEVMEKILAQLGHYEPQVLATHPDREKFKQMEGSSGFMLFDNINHGALLALAGKQQKAAQLVLGNPLFALEMTQHDIAAGLYAPLRMLVYANAAGTAIEYDQPSTLFGGAGNEAVRQAALPLDDKMEALVRGVL
jgi:uncharacterized protein (DUF302 family)